MPTTVPSRCSRGTSGRGIYDNMKTAVDRVFVGKNRLDNRRFLQMCSHYPSSRPPARRLLAAGWSFRSTASQPRYLRKFVAGAVGYYEGSSRYGPQGSSSDAPDVYFSGTLYRDVWLFCICVVFLKIFALATGPSGFHLRPCRQHIRSSEIAALRTPDSNLQRSGKNGRSRFRLSMKTFARWRSAPPARSLRQWAGRFRTRSECLPAGKWRRPIARPYFAMTSASPLTVRRPKRSTPWRGSWRPSGLRGSPHARS
jgi:hypothetical protein